MNHCCSLKHCSSSNCPIQLLWVSMPSIRLINWSTEGYTCLYLASWGEHPSKLVRLWTCKFYIFKQAFVCVLVLSSDPTIISPFSGTTRTAPETPNLTQNPSEQL